MHVSRCALFGYGVIRYFEVYLKVGTLGEDGLEGAFALCPQVVAAIVVDHARLWFKKRRKRVLKRETNESE